MKRSTALLFAAAFTGLLAQGANAVPITCADLVTPTLGDGLNSAGVVPAGPRLLSTGDGATGYSYVVNSASDNLELYVQSMPGVGSGNHYNRKLAIALSGTGTNSYYSVGTASGCKVSFDRFTVESPASGVTVTTDVDMATAVTSDSATCSFNHLYSVAWGTFRSTLSNCGFTLSDNTSALTNGTYRNYKGRVHVMWEDFANDTASTPVRPNMTTWYDVTIQVQSEANYTGNSTTNTETPYSSDFKVTGITYSKANDGAVTANIAYELSTNFPYYPSVPAGGHDYNVLIHSGSGGSATYAGLALGESGSSSYPGGAWSNALTLDGTVKSDGSACSAVQDVCVMRGTLSYTWTPTPAQTASCSISSATAYQFDFYLQCFANYNGTIASVCNVPMRQALDLTSFASFKFQGNVDFCKSAATDFPISWSQNFDVDSTTRQIGQTITASGSFSSNKQIAAVAIKEYRVARNDLTGYWSMWTAADDTATSAASVGSITTVGTNTQFGKSITSSNSGKNWAIATSFTPNIKLLTSNTALPAVSDRGVYLITLPQDKGANLAYQITLVIRLYSDSTQNFNGAKRRLLYRDTAVPVIKSARAVQDMEVQTKPVSVKVPENVQVDKNGAVTVVSASPQLSVGAIAGIAVAGAVVAAAAIGMTVLVVKRHKRNAEAAKQDAETASKAGSTDFLTKSGSAPDYSTFVATGGSYPTGGRVVVA